MLSAVFIFAVIGIKNATAAFKDKDTHTRKVHIVIASVSLAIVIVFVTLFALLIMSNL